jgi:uncharacterized protein YgfB (UPF0149 family)
MSRKVLLAGDEFLFDLYLPEDEEASLTVRCTALIQWFRIAHCVVE